jgi:GDP-4-dehydro-6-deoxy-D-mannose reductase
LIPRSVLVTGATGLVGQEVTPTLERAAVELHTSSRQEMSSRRHHTADLTSSSAADALLARTAPDVVVHLAGGRPHDPAALRRVNIDTTRNVLEGLARLGLHPYVLVTGSAAEYGESDDGPITESAPLRPISEYGRVKAEQTTVARRLCAEAAIPLTILRPFNVVSPRLPRSTALGNLRNQLLEQHGLHRTLRCGRLDIVRDYIPVTYLAEAIVRLVKTPTDEPVLNVCSGVGIELAGIVSSLASALGVVVAIEQVDELMAVPAAHSVVGDSGKLAAMGLRCIPTAATIAETLLAQ